MSQSTARPEPHPTQASDAPAYGVALMLTLPCLWIAFLVGMAQLLGVRSPAISKELALAAGGWNIVASLSLGFTIWLRKRWVWSFLVAYLGASGVVALGLTALIALNGFQIPGLPKMPAFRMLFQWLVTCLTPTALFLASAGFLYRSGTAFGVEHKASVATLFRLGGWLLLLTLALNVLFLGQLIGMGLF